VATTLNNLAGLYESQGRYEEAEPLYQRSLAISEKALGPDHPSVATTLNNLAGLYYRQGKYQKAGQAFERIITIFEKALGPDHPNLAVAMSNYAVILGKLERDAEAAKWTIKAEAIRQLRGRRE
jgi:tetratricopeptide (TPR) repeat protein